MLRIVFILIMTFTFIYIYDFYFKVIPKSIKKYSIYPVYKSKFSLISRKPIKEQISLYFAGSLVLFMAFTAVMILEYYFLNKEYIVKDLCKDTISKEMKANNPAYGIAMERCIADTKAPSLFKQILDTLDYYQKK